MTAVFLFIAGLALAGFALLFGEGNSGPVLLIGLSLIVGSIIMWIVKAVRPKNPDL